MFVIREGYFPMLIVYCQHYKSNDQSSQVHWQVKALLIVCLFECWSLHSMVGYVTKGGERPASSLALNCFATQACPRAAFYITIMGK